jgi:CubicO group peptidase (beta-lactamase class C family)
MLPARRSDCSSPSLAMRVRSPGSSALALGVVVVFVAMLGVACGRAPSDSSTGPGDLVGSDREGSGPGPDASASAQPSTPAPPCSTDLTPELARLGVPGLSAGIVKNGRLLCTAVAGTANIAEARPVTPDSVFLWASVSKTVTAVTLMTLLDEGAFALDDDVNARLPFPVRIPGCTAKSITYRQLFTHTSSIIEDEHEGAYPNSYVEGDSPVPLGRFLEDYLVPGRPGFDEDLNFESECPGTTVTYSNVASALLGFLAERIANQGFDELARKRIFDPLGMPTTSFRLKGLDPSRLAMPYKGTSGAFTPAGQFGFPTYPDGLVRSSVPEMARFLAMFIQLGELDGVRILSRASAEEMRRVQFPRLDDTQGLIWYFSEIGARRVLGHNGSDPGVSSNMYFDPADGVGVLLVANGAWDEDEVEAKKVMAKLFDEAARH